MAHVMTNPETPSKRLEYRSFIFRCGWWLQPCMLFENGEQRCFDMSMYMDQKSWARLKLDGSFMAAFVENGTVAWPGNIDIDPETLYEMSNSRV